MKFNSEISENRFLGSISASVSPFKNLLPKSKQKKNSNHRSRSKLNSENIAPINPNIQISDPPLSASIPFTKKLYAEPKVNPCTEECISSVEQKKLPADPDPPVKVVLRIRPANGLRSGDGTVRKVANDSVSVGDRTYTFDSVLDSKSTQEDVYQLVGAGLVKDALAGYNTTILAYGQTGSGKTYTMWGPPSAMVQDGPSANALQGIVPRIFQDLFSEIRKEQGNADVKQIYYQCRCSFIEVYNEKIGDLLDPTRRNLEIKDDGKIGFFVENLSEEYVTSCQEVTQILIKGSSSRNVGATSINSKSSRSHIIFTCIIESWCKESSSKCFGSSKTSRISLVDLAGFQRNALDGGAKEHIKEDKYIKKSMSQLGHLVNIVAEKSQYGKSEDIPFRSSCLTHLLRESFGGNAKLSIICAVIPENKCNGETLRTLRFAQRAKLMKNEPIINEIAEDDVNHLSDQIRQLKEELIRAKFSSGNSGHFKARSARESLNQLRLSLNRSLTLPQIDNGSNEEIRIDEEDVKELGLQIDDLNSSENGECSQLYSAEEGSEADFACENYLSCSEESENEEINSRVTRTSLSISGCHQLADLEDPVLSESPKISNLQRKSTVFSSSHLPYQDDDVTESSKNLDVLPQSDQQCDQKNSSLRSSRILPGNTESLAASLNRGLQIIDHHQKNSALTRSSVSFSFKHLALNSSSTSKGNSSVQTLPEDGKFSDASSASFVCVKCKRGGIISANEVEDGLNKWMMVKADKSESLNGLPTQITKDTENDLALALEREKTLDSICKKQAAQIEHLNQLLEQHSGCCNSSILSGIKKQLPPIYEHENEKDHLPNSNDKLLEWNNEENREPEFIKEKCEIKEVCEDLNPCMKKSFDVKERETLLKEIEVLRSQVKSCNEAPTYKSTDRLRSSLLLQSVQLRKSTTQARVTNEEDFEKERERWMEMESEWISLTDELRIDLESIRQTAEKAEMELRLEKKSTEELDDVLKRSVLGHARMVEHYTELQEKYDDLAAKHRAIMEGIAEVKGAAKKAGSKGHGYRFSKALAAELSTVRVEREREREFLKKENQSLKIQLKDTAEAIHAAGELLVRLRDAEETASLAEEKSAAILEENDRLRKQIEKLKRKHKMEMITMKQYLAGSRLPEAALRPLCREDSDIMQDDSTTTLQDDDDQAWRAEFGAIYQEHY